MSIKHSEWASMREIGRMPQQLLLIEDAVELITILESLFQSLGYDVIVAETGLEAIQHLKNSIPDVIITDVNLPLASGFEVLEFLRQQKQGQYTRAIVFTGDSSAKHAPQSNLADVILDKPIDIERLLSAIQDA